MRAAFAPADRDALKAAVGTCTSGGCAGGCLGETADGSCPTFAASIDATGNPYGVIGEWDVSAVTNMFESKCTLSLSLSVVTHFVLRSLIRQVEFHRITILTRLWWVGLSFLCCTLLSSCSV